MDLSLGREKTNLTPQRKAAAVPKSATDTMDASPGRQLEELHTELKDVLVHLSAETRSHAIASIRGVLSGLRQGQTIEEIVHETAGHRQKEVLAMLSSLGKVLRRDLPIIAAAMAAEFEEAPLIGTGLHVVLSTGEVVKGIVEEFDGSDNTWRVKLTDGSLTNWIKSREFVLDDEASQDNGTILTNLREEKIKKLQDVQKQIMSDFDELSADMAKDDKANWLTDPPFISLLCNSLVGNVG